MSYCHNGNCIRNRKADHRCLVASQLESANKTIKYYLSIAVIILSGITSMGIFGFLSKSHIEQEAGSSQYLSQINLLNNKLNSIDARKLSLNEQKSNSNQLKEEDFELLNRLNDRLKLLDDAVSEIRNKEALVFQVN